MKKPELIIILLAKRRFNIDTLKPKIIIIEGQDRVGKTTLIKELRKNIKNYKQLSISYSSPPKVDDYHIWFKNHYTKSTELFINLLDKNWTVILDRFYIGETVYGPLFRNTDTDYIWEIDKKFENNSSVWLITITDYTNKLMSRDDGLSNEKTSVDHENVRARFIGSHNKSSITNKLFINVSDDGWPNHSEILKLIYS